MTPVMKKQEENNTGIYILLGTGLLLRIIIASTVEGFANDVALFKLWADEAAHDLFNIYNSGIYLDYPPLYMYILFFVGKIVDIFALELTPWAHTLTIKLPSLLADIASGYLMYRLTGRFFTSRWALAIAAIYLFNPAIIINSAAWGQVDSFFTLLVIIAIFLVSMDKVPLSAAAFAASVLMKPQGIIFAPILVFALLKRKSIKEFGYAVLYGITAVILIILPFSLGQHPLWVFKLLLNTANSTSYASLNAFNFFALMGANLKQDSLPFLLLSYKSWGFILIFILLCAGCFFYLKGKGQQLPYITGLFMAAGFFMFSVRMHERYMYPVLALSLLSFIYSKDRRMLWIYALSTLTVFTNTFSVLYRMMVLDYPHVPPDDVVLFLTSLVNLLIFAYITKVITDITVKGREKHVEYKEPGCREHPIEKPRKVKPLGYDMIVMGIMTLIYLMAALINLGSSKVPQTAWKPEEEGQSIMIDLATERELSRVNYYWGRGKGSFTLEYMEPMGNFKTLAVLEDDDFYKWKYAELSVNARVFKLTAKTAGVSLMEMAFFEEGSMEPVDDIRLVGLPEGEYRECGAYNLFDEQDCVEYRPSFLTSTYFDEIYHARTAYEHLEGMEPYEWTHPPLGKILISTGIAVFGMNPFGWRIAGTLAGAAMIPLMYLFGLKLFGNRLAAFLCGFLMMFDFMHFTHTRIATIDSYTVLFVIFSYFYLYDYYIKSTHWPHDPGKLKDLFLCGLFFGMGVACKWSVLYGASGIAFVLILCEIQKYRRYNICNNSIKASPLKTFKALSTGYTLLYCVLFFIVVPAIIYLLSYIPFMRVPGSGYGLKDILLLQLKMYNYHSGLEASHPFASEWWSWPLMIRPIWLYVQKGLPEGSTSTIVSMGNPAIWWAGILILPASLIMSIKRREVYMAPVFIAILSLYLPWILVSRVAFIYHYFPIVPFIIMTIVYTINMSAQRWKNAKLWIYIYIAAVALLFIIFYPVLSGMEVKASYVEGLKWFKSWVF